MYSVHLYFKYVQNTYLVQNTKMNALKCKTLAELQCT